MTCFGSASSTDIDLKLWVSFLKVLLVDAPAPVLKPEEKVLIDLSNTPDLIKTIPSKAFCGQVRDQLTVFSFILLCFCSQY